VTRTRHPISLARAVMEKSPYVILAGAGADAFGARVGLEQVDPASFSQKRAGNRWSSSCRRKAARCHRVQWARRLRQRRHRFR